MLPQMSHININRLPSAQPVNKCCCQTQPTPADTHTPSPSSQTLHPVNICTLPMYFNGLQHFKLIILTGLLNQRLYLKSRRIKKKTSTSSVPDFIYSCTAVSEVSLKKCNLISSFRSMQAKTDVQQTHTVKKKSGGKQR